MDMIRLFGNEMDINPTILLQHFLPFLGFYVEKVSSDNSSLAERAMIDIYIVSNKFNPENTKLVDNVNNSKSILVLKDGWVSDSSIESIKYNESVGTEEFLIELIDKISRVIKKQNGARLLRSDPKWQFTAAHVAKVYVNHEILKANLFALKFYKQDEFYQWGIKKYGNFIGEMENYPTKSSYSNYLKYVLVLAKYEAYCLRARNFRTDNFKGLLVECNELLVNYKENEQLHILKADTLLNDDNWMDAGDRYQDEEIRHVAYPYLNLGKILRDYYKEYDNAVTILKRAISKNSHYYQAWYHLGICYTSQRNLSEAINSFKRVYSILENKFKSHLLSPFEMEYLYKAIMNLSIAHKVDLGDYASAYAYQDIANEIFRQHAMDEYLRLECKDEQEIENMPSKVYKITKNNIYVDLDKIY